MYLSTLEIGAAQHLSVKSVLTREQKPSLVTACDLKCIRVREGFWLFLVSTLSVNILPFPPPPHQKKKEKKKERKKGKKKTMKKTSSAEIFANNK